MGSQWVVLFQCKVCESGKTSRFNHPESCPVSVRRGECNLDSGPTLRCIVRRPPAFMQRPPVFIAIAYVFFHQCVSASADGAIAFSFFPVPLISISDSVSSCRRGTIEVEVAACSSGGSLWEISTCRTCVNTLRLLCVCFVVLRAEITIFGRDKACFKTYFQK